MLDAPGVFDEKGWLRIGFYGHQPSIAEPYILHESQGVIQSNVLSRPDLS